MVTPHITEILEELYAHDPSLRERESDVVAALEALLRAKPEVPKDDAFFTELKNTLLQNMPSKTSMQSSPSLFSSRSFSLIGAGAALALIIAVPVTYVLTSGKPLSFSHHENLAFTSLQTNAFGVLSFDAPTQSARPTSGMGGGGSPEQALSADKLIYWNPVGYAYHYTGDPLDLTAINPTVYRKSGTYTIEGNGLTSAVIGPVDLSAFQSAQIQNFSLKQRDKNGYSVSVSDDGSIYINANDGLWTTYNEPYTPLTQADIPSDEKLIAIARAFIQRYRMDTSLYGEPVVDRAQVLAADEVAKTGEIAYYPDMMNVTLPLMIEGVPVKQNDGSPYGMSISINIRNSMVVGASITSIQNIDRSTYTLETDPDRIFDVLKNGGPYNYFNNAEAEKIEDVDLGTPEVVLITQYQYENNENALLFIPALKFPIVKKPADFPLYQTSVVVPLPKDILDQATNTPPIYRTLDDGTSAPAEILSPEPVLIK